SRYVQKSLFAYDPSGPEFAAAIAAQRALTAAWGAAGCEIEAPAAAVDLRDGDVVIATAEGDGGDWIRDNDAFGAAPWQEPWCSLEADAPPTLRHLPGAWWHSGVAGTARQGVLATQTFTVAQPFVHVRVAGRGCRVQVVVDGLNLLRNPIYGGLHRPVDREEPHWLTFDLRAWRGSPAYVQCLDQRAPDLADEQRGTDEYPADAWLAVQAVIASEHGEPPATKGTLQVQAAPADGVPADVVAAAEALRRARAALRVAPTLPAMGEGTGVDAHVFLRGKHDLLGPVAPRRFLRALTGDDAGIDADCGSGRLALAAAVFATDDPLPARVFVNRVWHHLFGDGLARTVDNLGALGEPPTDPALLDWLARDFIDHGWSRKHLFRRVVLSQTYRRATVADEVAEARDPRNQLHHRQNVRRLEAEAVRDALLAVSGLLKDERFGPPVPLPHGQLVQARGWPRDSGPIDGAGRRSIYLAVRRNFLSPMLQAFDLPTPFATVGARSVSNVPAQSLTLLNDEFVHLACAAWAERLGDARADFDQGLDRSYRAAFARVPDADERARCAAFLEAAAAEHGTSRDAAAPWADLLHCLVVTKEFTFRR
ncbi:MAG: DUF1553 domain-containing protein, partial [Planctomycetes bacterium]|nr:DUF1553 domain-containing protein [Planctomycetota bacterium]